MPRYHSKPRPVSVSSDTPPTNATFSIPTFSFPSFSLPFPSQLFPNGGEILGNITMVFIVICLPWLATAQLERVTNQARGEGVRERGEFERAVKGARQRPREACEE